MTKTEKAVTWAIEIANDPAHGYDQDNRWGPDYDISFIRMYPVVSAKRLRSMSVICSITWTYLLVWYSPLLLL